jgi:hypothetical protein
VKEFIKKFYKEMAVIDDEKDIQGNKKNIDQER